MDEEIIGKSFVFNGQQSVKEESDIDSINSSENK